MFAWCKLYRAGRNIKRAIEVLVERLAEIFDFIESAGSVGIKSILKNNRAFVKKPFNLCKPEGRRCYRYPLYRNKQNEPLFSIFPAEPVSAACR